MKKYRIKSILSLINVPLIVLLMAILNVSGCFDSSTENSPLPLVDPSDKPVASQGEVLYNQNCAACHPVSSTLANTTVDQINAAISSISAMNTISLTADQLQQIADFLAGGGGVPPQIPTDGQGLYNTFCITCHSDPSTLAQRSVSQIENAIASVPSMQSISLDSTQKQSIADYLATFSSPPPAPGNPTAIDDTLSVPPNTSGVVSVLTNDSPLDGGALSFANFDLTTSNGGSVEDNGDNTFTYTPATDFVGEDTFTYTIAESGGGTATATVVVTISDQVIPNGQAFYAANCMVCHAAGTDDTTTAFNSSDLALKANPLITNMTIYGGQYQLMGTFYNVSQTNIDELKAYINTLAP